MGTKHVVLAIFNDEASADVAVKAYLEWEGQTEDQRPAGVIVLDDQGALKIDKLGRRSVGKAAGIGLVVSMLTPIGLAAGVIGGALLGTMHRQGLGLSDADRDRLGAELTGGKAAVGVVADSRDLDMVAARLSELGGTPEVHDLGDEAMAAVDSAAAAETMAGEPAAT